MFYTNCALLFKALASHYLISYCFKSTLLRCHLDTIKLYTFLHVRFDVFGQIYMPV